MAQHTNSVLCTLIDEQLKVTQDQIQRLEYAPAELRRTASKVEFPAQAPAVIEHIRRMRDEIDNYLGVHEVETTDSHL
jgi:hypothetical protein